MFNIATTRILHTADSGASRELHPWVWPLPRLHGLSPTIIENAHEFDPERRDILIGYDKGTPLPRFIPVFSVHDGAITYAGRTPNGYAMCLDHLGGWSTQHADFEHMFAMPTDRFRRRRKERVRAGDVLGYLGNSAPKLRFELLQFSEDDDAEPIDPIERMRRWVLLPWTEPHRAPSPQNRHHQITA